MTVRNRMTRRTAQLAARAGVLGSSVMLVVTATGVLPGGSPPAGAATNAGTAAIVSPDTQAPLTTGSADTPFSLKLPTAAACTGDSAKGGYTVTSYMVKGDVDPAALKFDPTSGPTSPAVGASFRQPLFEVGSGSPFAGVQTANADVDGGPGVIIGVSPFDLASAVTPADIPSGTYNLGIACIKGPSSADDQLDKFWTARMDITTSGGNLTWTAVQQTGTTTTVGTGGSTTTTKAGGSTTSTTRAGGSTTSTTRAGGSTTSTTAVGGATTTSTRAGGGTTGGGVSSSGTGGSLAQTGRSPLGMAFWAAVLLICGRMAVVLGRPPKVPTRG